MYAIAVIDILFSSEAATIQHNSTHVTMLYDTHGYILDKKNNQSYNQKIYVRVAMKRAPALVAVFRIWTYSTRLLGYLYMMWVYPRPPSDSR